MKKNRSSIPLGLILVLLAGACHADTAPIQGSDPYQNVYDDKKLKGILMRRIANASRKDGQIDPEFTFKYDKEGVIQDDFPGRYNLAALPKGEFFETADAAELDNYFGTIAKRIKLRLIS